MPGQVILRKQPPRPACGSAIVTCAGGTEGVLAGELNGLGMGEVREERGAVRCALRGCGDIPRLNRELRSASRVLLPLLRTQVADFDGVYRAVAGLAWDRLLPVGQTFAISATSRSARMPDHRFLAMRCKDAIVDVQRRAQGGERSSVDRRRPDVPVVVFLDDQELEVSLDTSGIPLHERGYRTEAGDAPLRETLAAAMLLHAGWPGPRALVDPFCGSGTIVIEAALLARGRTPGAIRSRWAWQRWEWMNPGQAGSTGDSGDEARDGATGRRAAGGSPPVILASDADPGMVEIARRNAQRAGVAADVRFSVADAAERLSTMRERGGLIVSNPPYGGRLSPPDLERTYAETGSALKRLGSGWEAWFLLGQEAPARALGLAPDRRESMFNGGTAVEFCHYHIRGGRKR